MVVVRVLQKCFIGNILRQVGAEFDYDGVINETVMVALEDLEPTSLPKKTKVKPKPKAKAVGMASGLDNPPVKPAAPGEHHGLPSPTD